MALQPHLTRSTDTSITPFLRPDHRLTDDLCHPRNQRSARTQVGTTHPAFAENPQDRLAVRLSRLMQSVNTLKDDQTARTFITMAVALLSSADDRSDMPVSYDSAANGLAPWQFRRVVAHVDANIDMPLRIPELAALEIGRAHV